MRLTLAWLLWLPAAAAAALPVVEHDLRVRLEPHTHSLAVTDTISWPDGWGGTAVFELHDGLEPRVVSGGRLERLGREQGAVPLERYRVHLAGDRRQITLRYHGRLHHPLSEYGEGIGRRQQLTPGHIAPDGVYLSPASGWYPNFPDAPQVRFRLAIEGPEGWSAVSQGARTETGWMEENPQRGIYLVAGRFHVSRRSAGHAEAAVYLRQKDPHLAGRYLDATADYLALFSGLLGDYPYAKFALVANFWETGYGMPSFTLLGPRVLRLPFILHSAYPHEIVHNWWGNGVYVDDTQGNWSEGLTAYMADHLLKEREGQGAAYRRDQLQKYAEHVSGARDFPLAAFTSRHSGASQAIGYGKGLMLFHMLRLRLGDETFLEGLRRFYRQHRFTEASYADIQRAFEAVSGATLGPLFQQWVTRTGAPRLHLGAARSNGRQVELTLVQKADGAPYALSVPVAFRLADGSVAERRVDLDSAQTTARIELPAAPVCLSVDPRFDLFRRLLPGELPVSLDSLLGADRLLLVTPSGAPGELRSAYRALAAAWAAGQPGVAVSSDRELDRLPSDRPVWLLGWENRFLGEVRRSLPEGLWQGDRLRLNGKIWPRKGNSFVAAVPRGDGAIGWLATDSPGAVPGLARKVPHYGKYGYLVFAGKAPDNRLKGQWPVTASPLVRRFDGQTGGCDIPPRAPLARLADSSKRRGAGFEIRGGQETPSTAGARPGGER